MIQAVTQRGRLLHTDTQIDTQAVPRTLVLCPTVDEAMIKSVSGDMQPGTWGQGEDIVFVLGSAVGMFNQLIKQFPTYIMLIHASHKKPALPPITALS